MPSILTLLRELRPDRRELVLFGCLWLKFLAFFTLVFNADQLNFSFRVVNDEIFRSLLRPAYHSLVILILVSLLNLFPRQKRVRAYVVLSLLLSLLLLVDLWYYRAFRVFPSFMMLRVARGMPLSLELILPFLRWFDAAVLVDLGVLWLVRLHFPAGEGQPKRMALQGVTFLGLFFLVAPVAGGVIGSKAAQDHFRAYDSVGESVLRTPLAFHALELASFLRRGGSFGVALTGAERTRIKDWLDRNREDLPQGPLHGRLAGRNLLIIQVESLESFVFDLQVKGHPVTPCLNALKRQGLFFTQFHEQVNCGTSSDADLMTNASVYPLRNEATFSLFPSATLPSLPRILAGQGYGCLSIHPDKGSIWNATMGLSALGFSPCLDSSAFDCTDSFGMGLADASFLQQVEPRLAAMPSPFYAFMVTLSNHLPFELPEHLKELPLDPALDQEVMGGYLQSVHYTDRHLGSFLERLRQRGLLDNTVVVITGDHQGVHKYCAQELHQSALAEPWWEEKERRIPFLILAKGLEPRELGVQGGQVDIMPTLLDLLGIDPGAWAGRMMGRNLLNTRRNLCVLTDGRVLGEAGEEAVRHCREGLDIADQIIRGDYFASLKGGEPGLQADLARPR